MQKAVEAALELIRPVLVQDGGNIELVACHDDGLVQVRLTGNCKGCPHATETLRSIVERTLLKTVAGVKRVERVE